MIRSTLHRKLSLFVCLLAAATLRAQQPGSSDQNSPEPPATPVTMFPHPDSAPYLISGQANIVFQGHPGFHSPYSGANSMLARGEYKVSLVGTLFTGFQLKKDPRFATDAIFDLESAGG